MSHTNLDPAVPTGDRIVPTDSASQATANANAAAGAFLDFQAKIDLVMSQLGGETVTEKISDLSAQIHILRTRVVWLESVTGQNANANADDSDFQDCAHVAPGTPC